MADVLVFKQGDLELYKGRKRVRHFPYDDLEQVKYTHFRRSRYGMLSMLGGNLFGSREAIFRFRLEGEWLEVALELDAEYRGGEIRRLLEYLYRKGVPLFEYDQAGLELFLLEPLGRDQRSDKVAELINGSEPDERNS